ncbi:MAG TPA: hypothetical protein VEY71_11575, partial [Chitinophagales bacterium]|nr:hypothetical protein [Chitinophagales bacterium]
ERLWATAHCVIINNARIYNGLFMKRKVIVYDEKETNVWSIREADEPLGVSFFPTHEFLTDGS